MGYFQWGPAENRLVFVDMICGGDLADKAVIHPQNRADAIRPIAIRGFVETYDIQIVG